MKNLNLENIDDVLRGISLLCGGGGGDPQKAEKRMKGVLGEVRVRNLSDFDDEDVLISVFGVGGLKTEERNVKTAIEKGLDVFEEEFGIEPSGIIPVEVGAGSISEAVLAAESLNLPIVDADIVGNRCAPEIYLETITLTDIERTPLIAASPDGDIEVIKEAEGHEDLENRLRSLTSEKIWYVIGYPCSVKPLRGNIAEGWFEKSIDIGRKLEEGEVPRNWEELGKGVIQDESLEERNGFTVGRIEITGKNDLQVLVKNENILTLQGGEILTEAPKNISIIDAETYEGIYNGNVEPGIEVKVLSSEPNPLWKSKEAKKLFSKENLGFELTKENLKYQGQKFGENNPMEEK